MAYVSRRHIFAASAASIGALVALSGCAASDSEPPSTRVSSSATAPFSASTQTPLAPTEDAATAARPDSPKGTDPALTNVAAGRAPTPEQVLAAAKSSGVKLVVEPGWNEEWDLPSRQSDWQPVGVMLHHTGTATAGDAPTRQFLLDYESTLPLDRYDGVAGGKRGCAFLVGRDGTVYFMRATRGPQAGTGGPMVLGKDSIPADNANGYTYGIEIESQGESADIHSSEDETDGFSQAQVEATAKLSAALLKMVNRGPENLTDHKAWAAEAQGKPDLIGNALEVFREATAKVMQSRDSG